MRITSGILKNRQFNVPKPEVRPTMEAVREAVFSSLGGHCKGLKVLDLFAGSGALGLEAWSRGAASVTWVEKHPQVFRALEQTVEELRDEALGPGRCIRADALRWLAQAGERFDLILADPPYDLPDAPAQTLGGIAKHSVLTADGTLVYELRAKGAVDLSGGWSVRRDKTYGRTRVLILKQSNEEQP